LIYIYAFGRLIYPPVQMLRVSEDVLNWSKVTVETRETHYKA